LTDLGDFVELELTGRKLLFLVGLFQVGDLDLQGLFEGGLLLIGDRLLDLFTQLGDVLQDAVAASGVVTLGPSDVKSSGNGWDNDVGSQVKVGFFVGVSLGGTFLGSSNVNFIELESAGLALKKGKEPGGRADTGGLKEKGGLKEDVDDRVAQESNREASSNQLPGDGTKDGGGDGTHESKVEDVKLDPVRDTEDGRLGGNINIDGGDTGNDEEAKGDSHLTTAHESRKVLSVVLEKALASLEGKVGSSTLRLRKLGDGEESNLHTFKKTDAAHEDEEEDERDSLRKGVPGGGLSKVKSFDGDSKGESEDAERKKDTSPEEGEGKSGLRRLVGFDRLSGGPVSHVSDKVGSVHDTSDLDTGSNPVSENHEVVVDVVKHHVGSVTLGSQLSDNNVLQDHSNTRSEEDGRNPVRKSKNLSSRKRGSADSDGEVDEDNHELTSHEVSVEVVSLVSPSGDLVGDRVGFLVKFAVDWRKSDHRALSSLNHGHPGDKRPHDNGSSSRVDITSDLGVSSGNQSQDDSDGKDEKEQRKDNSDLVQDGADSVRFVIGTHIEEIIEFTVV